jgi:beta-glucosidase
VLNNGSALAMSEWIEGTAAVLEAWMMGQAGGGAIADVLFGKVNPSGKLAETFPVKLADTPAYINYPGGHGEVRYGEGIFIGYRYYDAKEMPVQFPFGYGGSYTTFEYNAPRVSASTFKDTDGITVSVDVTNTGKVAGKETVQVYVHDHQSTLARPPKELKGFAKVELQPGETKTVAIPLDFRAFAFYHPGYGQWITEDGQFDILVGASAGDIRHKETVTLQSTLHLPSVLNRESTVRAWMRDPKGKAIFEQTFPGLISRMAEMFTIGDGEELGENNQMMGLLDMPLLSLLEFQAENLPALPDDMVNAALAQVRGGK